MFTSNILYVGKPFHFIYMQNFATDNACSTENAVLKFAIFQF